MLIQDAVAAQLAQGASDVLGCHGAGSRLRPCAGALGGGAAL